MFVYIRTPIVFPPLMACAPSHALPELSTHTGHHCNQ